MGTPALQTELAPLTACTISRDVQNFDLLIEDMETALGENWGDLGFDDALAFFKQPDAETLEFVAVAVDEDDEENLSQVAEIITAARDANIKVILIAEDLTPVALHQLLRLGANDFVPYPLPEGELAAAIERLNAPEPEAPVPAELQPTLTASSNSRNGLILPVHGLAGGTGASTFAVNLAWELALIDKENAPRVCLLDLDLQFGATSTYLDLPRREAVFELLSDTENMDSDSFMQALLSFNEKLHVLTAPTDIIPLDLIQPEDVARILDVAKANFDYVVVDMPSTLVSWTETVLNASAVYFCPIEMEMRSAQNVLRMIKALKAEDLPHDKLRFAVNRSPKFTDLQGKSRVKRMAESLDVSLELLLPDGGKPVSQAGDHGLPLAETAAKNPLRKEIMKLAASLHEMAQGTKSQAAKG
ncbi:AAA family ATPase [Nereida sp. MMG025]|uniref:AAA family ATPase n=1 Tax=Nereida sp. MMG025 TaxID=2909981 RepID=UPI001F473304|nr:AAA family ATPase [Nereida sp. MMG025]MCF6445001.1 AAA family ATPase [Nereida sp. MMG025]